MNVRTIGAIAAAAMMLLAGCSAGVGDGGPGGASTTAPAGTDALGTAGGTAESGGGGSGTLHFYLSDERNAIDDFERLNVTVTKVGFKRAGPAEEEAVSEETGTNTMAETTTTAETNGTANASALVAETVTATTGAAQTTAGTTTAPEPETSAAGETATATAANATTAAETEAATSEEDAADADREGWVTYDVDGRTVDLTELQGANATRLGALSLPAGEYETVFVYVSEVEGVLTTGERVDVKLPSERLKLNKGIAVGDGSDVNFVFDITVHEAGGSGKYILRPVVGQSGTDVPIRDVDGRDSRNPGNGNGTGPGDATRGGQPTDRGPAGEDTRGGPDNRGNGDGRAPENRTESADNAGLAVEFVGPVRTGEEATVSVTLDGEPVEDAEVQVDGETAGRTAANGRLAVTVPDTDEVRVVAKTDSAVATTTRSL